MDIQLLNSFLVLTRYENFTRAAAALFISQPTLTKHIATLEEKLGVMLVNRNKRGFELTEAGELLKREGDKFIAYSNDIKQRLLDTETSDYGSLYLKTMPMYHPALYDAFAEFDGAYPNVLFSVGHLRYDEVLNSLSMGMCDAAILRTYEVEQLVVGDEYAFRRLFDGHFVAVFSPTHPLAERENVSCNDLLQYTALYMRYLKSLPARAFYEAIEAIGSPTLQSNWLPKTLEDMIFLILHDKGYALVDSAQAPFMGNGSRVLEITDLNITFGAVLVYKKENSNRTLRHFEGILTKHLPDFSDYDPRLD